MNRPQGKTAFVEPAVIVELNNRVRELENAEKREIIKIFDPIFKRNTPRN